MASIGGGAKPGGNRGPKGPTGASGTPGTQLYVIAHGIKTCAFSQGYPTSSAGPFPVTFPSGRFTAVPKLVLTQGSLPANTGKWLVKYTNLTSSGFSIYFYNGDNTALDPTNPGTSNLFINWLAVQEL